MRRATAWSALFAVLVLAACRGHDATAPSQPAPTAAPAAAAPAAAPAAPAAANPSAMTTPTPGPTLATQTATFANGCFWCTEAVLEQLPGVIDVVSGYMGGDVEQPTYEQVCGGETGHAECVQVTFDPAKVAYNDLLDWFFRSHDPTTLNRQGADVGTQYRSAVFFHSDDQKAATLAAIQRFQPKFAAPIVTEVTAASRFWPAEPYHQDYFRRNPNQGYCRIVIAPKLKKLGLDDAK